MTILQILSILVVLTIVAIVLYNVSAQFRKTVLVQEHEFSLHFQKGKFIGLLDAGEHRFLGRHHEVRTLDKRATELSISGQELLTKDQAPLKVSGLIRYRIVDPRQYLIASAHPESVLYTAGQMAIRNVLSSATLEEVLARNTDSGTELTRLVQATGEQLGLKVETVLVKDLMPSGEIKSVFTETLLAKKRVLNDLERARGEAAALRIKSNAARLYEKHPALLQLELIQAIESNGLGMNNTFSFGAVDQLTQLLKGE